VHRYLNRSFFASFDQAIEPLIQLVLQRRFGVVPESQNAKWRFRNTTYLELAPALFEIPGDESLYLSTGTEGGNTGTEGGNTGTEGGNVGDSPSVSSTPFKQEFFGLFEGDKNIIGFETQIGDRLVALYANRASYLYLVEERLFDSARRIEIDADLKSNFLERLRNYRETSGLLSSNDPSGAVTAIADHLGQSMKCTLDRPKDSPEFNSLELKVKMPGMPNEQSFEIPFQVNPGQTRDWFLEVGRTPENLGYVVDVRGLFFTDLSLISGTLGKDMAIGYLGNIPYLIVSVKETQGLMGLYGLWTPNYNLGGPLDPSRPRLGNGIKDVRIPCALDRGLKEIIDRPNSADAPLEMLQLYLDKIRKDSR
jgi:hypothetical protein